MKTRFRTYYLIFSSFLLALHFFTNAAAQDLEAKVEIRGENPSIAAITGRFPAFANNRNLSFQRSVAGFSELSDRIKNLKLFDASGKQIAYQAIAGEYVSDATFAAWSYSVDLAPRKEPAAAAHVSWIANGNGLLMLGDLLPFVADGRNVSGRVVIALPQGWRQLENRVNGTIDSDDIFSEVASVGTDVRYRTVHSNGTSVSICLAGNWLFTDDEIANFVQSIYAKTSEIFSSPAGKEVYINVFRFPQNIPHGQWQAETRGRSVTIVSSDMAFQTQSLQRLHEQLRHEILHLWIPNAVNLAGNYDWFYEGFALYSSLKLAVEQNQIRFEDMLDTLSRAYAIDSRQTKRISLIETSRSRWDGNETYLYARGMFAAFLCDIAMLGNSKSKRSINDLLREIYGKHKFPADRADGTEAVLAIMKTRPELGPIVDRYILGSSKFEVAAEIETVGLELSNGLRVKPKLNGKQKDLLDSMGYNNWRRLSPGPIR
jgi:hypothetical protein